MKNSENRKELKNPGTTVADYNNKRTNPGKRCKGRTLRETFDASYELFKKM